MSRGADAIIVDRADGSNGRVDPSRRDAGMTAGTIAAGRKAGAANASSGPWSAATSKAVRRAKRPHRCRRWLATAAAV